MKISIDREHLLSALQAVAAVVERRQTLPVLSNVLLSAEGMDLSLTATDMEVESIARVEATVARPGAVTVPGRKLLDICRSLPAQCSVMLEEKEGKVRLQTGRSRFSLSTLPASDFPTLASVDEAFSLDIDSTVLQSLIGSTQFAMAHQDVRYYLNGLLLEVGPKGLKAVATDGHRLAMAEALQTGIQGDKLRRRNPAFGRSGQWLDYADWLRQSNQGQGRSSVTDGKTRRWQIPRLRTGDTA